MKLSSSAFLAIGIPAYKRVKRGVNTACRTHCDVASDFRSPARRSRLHARVVCKSGRLIERGRAVIFDRSAQHLVLAFQFFDTPLQCLNTGFQIGKHLLSVSVVDDTRAVKSHTSSSSFSAFCELWPAGRCRRIRPKFSPVPTKVTTR